MEPPESGSFENKAFDRILSMMPSPVTPKLDKEKRRLTSQYSSSADGVLTEARPKPTPTETSPTKSDAPSDSKPDATPPVDIHNLWSQLLGAGLVGGGQSSGGIPGLEAQAPATKVTETASEKKETNKTVKSEEAPKAATAKTPDKVETVKPVVLKSHHKSLKE